MNLLVMLGGFVFSVTSVRTLSLLCWLFTRLPCAGEGDGEGVQRAYAPLRLPISRLPSQMPPRPGRSIATDFFAASSASV